MSFRVELDRPHFARTINFPSTNFHHDGVFGAVKGGQSRSGFGIRPASPSGGKDFPALEGGDWGG